MSIYIALYIFMCVCISLHALVSMLYLLATMKTVSHRKATLM